jgi:hypothetical protein
LRDSGILRLSEDIAFSKNFECPIGNQTRKSSQAHLGRELKKKKKKNPQTEK